MRREWCGGAGARAGVRGYPAATRSTPACAPRKIPRHPSSRTCATLVYRHPMRRGIPCGTVSHAARYPMRHGIPCGAVSHAARYPMRHGIPCGTRADAMRHVVPCRAPRDTLHAAQRDARRRSPQMHERAECCKIAQNVATGCAALQHGVLQHGSCCAPGGRGARPRSAAPRRARCTRSAGTPLRHRTVKPAQRLTDASTSEGRRNDTVSPAARYGHSEDPLRHGVPTLGYPTTQGIPHRRMVSQAEPVSHDGTVSRAAQFAPAVVAARLRDCSRTFACATTPLSPSVPQSLNSLPPHTVARALAMGSVFLRTQWCVRSYQDSLLANPT
jgi:hypothetical protein